MVEVIPVAEAVVSTVWPDTVRLDVLAFPKVVCPVTESVPLEVKDEVAVMEPNVEDPPVSVDMTPVRAFRLVAKRLVEVAFVSVAFVAVKLVIAAVTALRRVAKRLDEVALVFTRLEMVPLVA